MQNTQCNLKKVNFTPIEKEKVKSYFIKSSQTLMRSFHFKNGENLIYQERLRTAQVRLVSDQILISDYYTQSRCFNKKSQSYKLQYLIIRIITRYQTRKFNSSVPNGFSTARVGKMTEFRLLVPFSVNSLKFQCLDFEKSD